MDIIGSMRCTLGPLGRLGSAAFDEHLPVAVAAAHRLERPLTLALLRTSPSGRAGRRRLTDALARAPAFVYEFQPDCFALLMPRTAGAEALDAVMSLRARARGGLLAPGAVVDAGAAEHEPGTDARELFDAAAAALDLAECAGGGVAFARPMSRRLALVA